jgi:hypothetical protein
VNAIQCLVPLGRGDEARELGKEIKSRQPEPGALTAVLLGLAWLGDCPAIKRIFDRARQGGHKPSAWEYQLAGTAEGRLGNEKVAQRYWHRAVNRDPDISVARENLESGTDSFIGEPRFIPFAMWVPARLEHEFTERNNTEGDAIVQDGEMWSHMTGIAPWLPSAIPHMIQNGDRRTRVFALRLASASDRPDLQQVAVDYTRSGAGLADLRRLAADTIRSGQEPPSLFGPTAYRPFDEIG